MLEQIDDKSISEFAVEHNCQEDISDKLNVRQRLSVLLDQVQSY